MVADVEGRPAGDRRRQTTGHPRVSFFFSSSSSVTTADMNRTPLGLAVLLTLHVAIAAAGEDCSGHGKRADDGSCQCDGSWPEPGSSGWTGPDCALPVSGGSADGSDMTGWCHGSGCASLAPGNWSCFAVRAPWK